ncbi:uncharacterized protein AB675_1817 [Cyphellophora attinorum]|uniref:FAS1 domain-containing protein n=1 Tax=Cyphellophora attinorum TaxID=1664694 RepID=A0A0N1HXU3_9EURO|nr:uncharacterized protein AB675_1817 [Phialophora attinorum]KPI42932.1 hypothetical protein AB675_1817 [Phialophora attinorum]
MNKLWNITLSLAILAHAAVAAAQNSSAFLDALRYDPNLSELSTWIEANPDAMPEIPQGNYNFLAPTNDAFQNLMSGGESLINLLNSAETQYLKDLFNYHMIRLPRDFMMAEAEHAFLETGLSYEGASQHYMIEAYRERGIDNVGILFTSGSFGNMSEVAQDGRIYVGEDFNSGVITTVKEVLTLPQPLVYTLINLTEKDLRQGFDNCSIFSRLFADGTDQEDYLGLSGPATFLVPINTAFEHASVADVDAMSTEKKFQILGNHHIPSEAAFFQTSTQDLLQSQGVKVDETPVLRTTNGSEVRLTFDPNRQKWIIKHDMNEAQVLVPNLVVKGGVAHLVSAVLGVPEASNNTSSAQSSGAMGSSRASWHALGIGWCAAVLAMSMPLL